MTRGDIILIVASIVIIGLIIWGISSSGAPSKPGALPIPAAQQLQEQCLARVAEVLLYKQPGRPVAELELARKLCYDGERPATRVLYQLNQGKPKLKDGRVK